MKKLKQYKVFRYTSYLLALVVLLLEVFARWWLLVICELWECCRELVDNYRRAFAEFKREVRDAEAWHSIDRMVDMFGKGKDGG